MKEELESAAEITTAASHIVNSELLEKIYDDTMPGASSELGGLLTDSAKAIRLVLVPFKLLANCKDLLWAYIDRAANKVPEDRQQQADPSVAAPLLLEMRFMMPDNPLTDLYINLLARAMDKARCDEVHPAFLKIIGQLSPLGALILLGFPNLESR